MILTKITIKILIMNKNIMSSEEIIRARAKNKKILEI